MSNVDLSANASMPGFGCGIFAEELFAPKNFQTLSLMRKVAPASNAVPKGAIKSDGSIDFGIPTAPPNVHYDALGKVIAVVSPTGKTTSFAYDTQSRLTKIRYSDDSILELRHHQWFDGKGVKSCWSEIVVLQDGTLWCKRSDGVIMNKNVDDTFTIQNVAHRFMLWYDSGDRLSSIRYPNGQSRSFAYDINGLKSMIEPDGSVFFLENGVWYHDRDSELLIDELKVYKEGTVAYKVGNHIIATSASGRVKRIALRQGDVGFQKPIAKPQPNLTTDAGSSTPESIVDLAINNKIEHRLRLQRAFMHCPLDYVDFKDADEDGMVEAESQLDRDRLRIGLYQIQADKDLPLTKRLDLAASEVSNYLFGTFPLAVVRIIEQDGEIERAIVKQISDASAQWFGHKVQDMLSRDSVFAEKLEQAIVERLIIGGTRIENPELYFAITPDGLNYQIVNDNLEGTFDPEMKQPQWDHTNSALFERFVNTCRTNWLSVETLARIGSFLNYFNCADGKEYLSNFGLYDDEIECLISRAAWLLENKCLPRC